MLIGVAILFVFCGLGPNSFAQLSSSGYYVQDLYARACVNPYRSFDAGGSFTDLAALFRYQTNHAYSATARNPMPDWYLIAGRVSDVGVGQREGSLLIRVDKQVSTLGVAGNAEQIIIHLANHPGAERLIDGSVVVCFALPAGRHQYRTVLGATATVLSYDHGKLPTADQYAAMEKKKWEDYKARVEALKATRTNKPAPVPNTNHSITPARK